MGIVPAVLGSSSRAAAATHLGAHTGQLLLDLLQLLLLAAVRIHQLLRSFLHLPSLPRLVHSAAGSSSLQLPHRGPESLVQHAGLAALLRWGGRRMRSRRGCPTTRGTTSAEAAHQPPRARGCCGVAHASGGMPSHVHQPYPPTPCQPALDAGRGVRQHGERSFLLPAPCHPPSSSSPTAMRLGLRPARQR
jgi:hypothetical protein